MDAFAINKLCKLNFRYFDTVTDTDTVTDFDTVTDSVSLASLARQ